MKHESGTITRRRVKLTDNVIIAGLIDAQNRQPTPGSAVLVGVPDGTDDGLDAIRLVLFSSAAELWKKIGTEECKLHSIMNGVPIIDFETPPKGELI